MTKTKSWKTNKVGHKVSLEDVKGLKDPKALADAEDLRARIDLSSPHRAHRRTRGLQTEQAVLRFPFGFITAGWMIVRFQVVSNDTAPCRGPPRRYNEAAGLATSKPEATG